MKKLKIGSIVRLVDGVKYDGKPVTRARIISIRPLFLAFFTADKGEQISEAKRIMIAEVF